MTEQLKPQSWWQTLPGILTAMDAGLPARVWTRREVVRLRVPPWPQPQVLESVGEENDRELVSGRCVHQEVNRAEQVLQPCAAKR